MMPAALRPTFREPNANKKKAMMAKLVTETFQPHLAIIQQRLVDNGSGYLVGKSVVKIDWIKTLFS